MGKYGVSMADAQAVIEMAIENRATTSFYEDERILGVFLRFQKDYRDNEDKIGEILIPMRSGEKILLREIAHIEFITGPTFIYREGSSRYIAAGFSVDGRDVEVTTAEARAKVKE